MLDRGTLSAAELRILRGRLVFAEAQIYGRLSGLHMQNLSRWEHAIGDTLTDDDLRRSLEFVRDRVLKGGPRMVEGTRWCSLQIVRTNSGTLGPPPNSYNLLQRTLGPHIVTTSYN